MKELKKANLVKALKLFDLNFDDFKAKDVVDIFEKIRQSYKKCALKYHPDKNKSPEAEEQFKKISNVYTLFDKAYENGTLADLFMTDSVLTSPATGTLKKATPITVSWLFSDSIKNSLYSYYDGRYGELANLPGQAHEKLRSMLVQILGIPAMGFWVEINNTGRGYVVKSSEQYLINIMSEFLTTIAEYALDSLKPIAFQYEIQPAQAQLFCKSDTVDADLVTMVIKKAMKVENTANIVTVYVESQKNYLVYIKTDAPETVPEFLGKPIVTPSQTQGLTSAVVVKKTAPVIAQKSTIQLAFGLDVTGSMGNMLSAAKQSLRKAGISIQKSMNESPDMFVVTYHDYDDEGKNLSNDFGRGGRWERGSTGDRFGGTSASRFTEKDEEIDKLTISVGNAEPTEPKLLDALNYSGKRDEGKLPIFTSPEVVSNILDAVGAEGVVIYLKC